jgi:hypothetical protein
MGSSSGITGMEVLKAPVKGGGMNPVLKAQGKI